MGLCVCFSLNPRWDEKFVFTVQYPESTILIQVFDDDNLSKDDLLGQIEVPISLLSDGKVHDCWYYLRHPKKVTLNKFFSLS